MERRRRTGWTGGQRPKHASARAASQVLPVTFTALPSALLPANTFLTETGLHSKTALTHSKQSTGTFLTGARIALKHRTTSTPAAQKLALVKLRNRYDIHGSNTFLPGSAQQVEFAVTHSKQSTATFLPGSRIASLAHSKSSNIDSKLSEGRAWLRL
jgi:hypothetical protein